MHKRRQIREAAVQFLYFADLEEGPDASEVNDAFWQIVQESSLLKHSNARAKAVLHIAQGRDSRLAKLADRTVTAIAELKVVDGTNSISTALKKINSQESKLSAALSLLKTAHRAKSDDNLLEPRLQEVFDISRSLASFRLSWQHALDDFPAWKNKLEGLTATISHLGRVSERLDAINSPEGLPGLEHLRSTQKEIFSFRQETEQLIFAVLGDKSAIDAKLAETVENFSPERIAPVDRAILRVSAHEILNCPDIPTAVSINEAIEIAKKFGGTESSRFVNGVLDALAK